MAEETIAPSDDFTHTPGEHFAPEPKQIGQYHIVGRISEGGMGAVYKAEQRRPILRTVAIKVIKLGFDSKEVIARFDSERQALARMDHPNIAMVLDAGTTETGGWAGCEDGHSNHQPASLAADFLEHHAPPTVHKSVIANFTIRGVNADCRR